jgi:hypothetical protein
MRDRSHAVYVRVFLDDYGQRWLRLTCRLRWRPGRKMRERIVRPIPHIHQHTQFHGRQIHHRGVPPALPEMVPPSEYPSGCSRLEPSRSLPEVFSPRSREAASVHVRQLGFEGSYGKFQIEPPLE